MGDIHVGQWVRPVQIMEWRKDASLALVDEYRKHPVLWDVKHPSYTLKNKKQEAWEAIAASMQLDVHEVKQKMHSLLGSFRREKAKMKQTRESNDQTGGYCSKWFAFERMQFLLRGSENDMIAAKDDDEDLLFDELSCEEPSEVGQEGKNTSPKKTIRIPKLVPDPILEDLSIFSTQDECTAFGQYIACKLRKFDSRTRAFVEHAISNIIFEAEMGKLDNVLPPPVDQQTWDPLATNDSQIVSDSLLHSAPSLNDND